DRPLEFARPRPTRAPAVDPATRPPADPRPSSRSPTAFCPPKTAPNGSPPGRRPRRSLRAAASRRRAGPEETEGDGPGGVGNDGLAVQGGGAAGRRVEPAQTVEGDERR